MTIKNKQSGESRRNRRVDKKCSRIFDFLASEKERKKATNSFQYSFSLVPSLFFSFGKRKQVVEKAASFGHSVSSFRSDSFGRRRGGGKLNSKTQVDCIDKGDIKTPQARLILHIVVYFL